MSEYKRNTVEKREYYLGNLGKIVKAKNDCIFVTVETTADNNTTTESYVRVENNKPALRDGINKNVSVTINPKFIKLTPQESENYKSYLFNGKSGLYTVVHASMKGRGVL